MDPQQWKHGVLTTGPPGNSPCFLSFFSLLPVHPAVLINILETACCTYFEYYLFLSPPARMLALRFCLFHSLLSSLACIWHQAHAHNIFGGNKKDAVELFSSQSIVNDCKVGSMVPGGECPSSNCWLTVMIVSYSQDRCEDQMGHWTPRHAADTTARAGGTALGPLSLRGNLRPDFMLFHFHTLWERREGSPGDHWPLRVQQGERPVLRGVGSRQRQEPGSGSPARGLPWLPHVSPHVGMFVCIYYIICTTVCFNIWTY